MATTLNSFHARGAELASPADAKDRISISPLARTAALGGDKRSEMLHIPESLVGFPWQRTINPHHAEVGPLSSNWLRSFHAFPDNVQRAFDACNFNLLALLAYPNHSKEHIRIACDVMQVFFVIEEFTDSATVEEATAVVNMVMDALRNPHTPRPDAEKATCPAGEIARQFWANAVQSASRSCQARFIATFDGYTQSVVREAEDRNRAQALALAPTTHTVDSYLALRRETVGCWSSFALIGLATEHLTDAVMDHALVDALSQLATELVLVGNDIVSYNKERKDGAGHNLVTVVLTNPPATHAYIATPQQAVDWASEYHSVLAQNFLRVYDAVLLTFGPDGSDADASTFTPDERQALLHYVDGLGHWVRANDQWSYESARYFGKQGLQVQKTRMVELIPLGGGSGGSGGSK